MKRVNANRLLRGCLGSSEQSKRLRKAHGRGKRSLNWLQTKQRRLDAPRAREPRSVISPSMAARTKQ